MKLKKHYTKWKKPARHKETYILYDLIYMKFLEKAILQPKVENGAGC